jgi:hypothetical protein
MGYFLGKGAGAPISFGANTMDQSAQGTGGARTGTREQCLERCDEKYRQMLADANISNERAERMWNRCVSRCDETEPGGDDSPPCEGGYLGMQGDRWIRCEEGYHAVNKNGKHWCCPGAGQEPDNPEKPTWPCAGGYKVGNIGGKQITPCKEGFVPVGQLQDGSFGCCPQGDVPGPEEPGDDMPCEGGYRLTDDPVNPGGGKIWTDEFISAKDGWYRDPQAQGHKIWHRDYGYQQLEDVHAFLRGEQQLTKNTGGACKKGYKQTNINGEAWCCPDAGGGGGGDGLGYFQWPQELMDLYGGLVQRGTDLLGKEPGFSDEAISTMFGQNYDRARQTGDLAREQVMNQLQTEGLAGTGTSQDVGMDTAWQTEKAVNDVMEHVFLANEAQKRQDLNLYTNLANMILGTGSGFISGGEAINAGRRGEQRQSLQMLMEFLRMLLGSYGQ